MKANRPTLAQLPESARRVIVRRLAANPQTRAAIPAQYLPAKYARGRSLQGRLNAPVVPGSSLTNRDLAHEASAAVQTQYAPEQTTLNQNMASNANQSRQDSGYFDDYVKALNAAIAQAGTNGRALVSQLGQIQPSGTSNANLAAAQADAASRGATVDPTIAVKAQQAQGINQGVMAAYQGQAGVQALAQQHYLQGLVAAAEAGKVQALNQVASQGQSLQAQNQQLAREKGAADLAYRTKRRSEESTNVATAALANVNAAATAAKVGIAQQNANTQAKRASSSAKTARTAQQTKDATFAATHEGYTPTEFATLSPANQLQVLQDVAAATRAPKTTGPGSGKDSYGNTPVQRRAAQDAFDKALTVAQPVSGESFDDVYQFLVSVKNQNPLYARAAAQRVTGSGHLGPNTLKSLKRRGVKNLHKPDVKLTPDQQKSVTKAVHTGI